MFPLHSPIQARTESLKEEEVVVTKYKKVQFQQHHNQAGDKDGEGENNVEGTTSSTPINSSYADTC